MPYPVKTDEAYVVFVLNQERMLEIIQNCVDLEFARKDLTSRIWPAREIHWLYERAGVPIPERKLKDNAEKQDGIQKDGTYRLNDTQALLILGMPLRCLLNVERDKILHRWNENFLLEHRRSQ
jgi:DNA gyrase subunit A